MHEFGILKDLMIVFAASGLVVFLFGRLRIPSVVGLLVSGLVVGPYGFGLIHEKEQVQLLAEIGVVVLLFTVGLEFSLTGLLAQWRTMLAVGLPQVFLTVGVVALLTRGLLDSWGHAIFVGMLVAMSSTAVVLKVLTDRGELGAPQGRLAVAVLLLQDLLVTVFILAIPLLAAGPGGGSFASLLPELAKGFGVVIAVLVGSRYVLGPILNQVVRTRNRELFLIFVSLVCIGTAATTAAVGLSLALGAFLAGLALSESEYSHMMFSEVLPFRDTLSSLFFVSVGMLLDLRFVAEHPLTVGLAVVAVLVIKALAAGVPTLVIGYPPRVAVLVGAALLQIGEFSFVLAGRGQEAGLIGGSGYQTFLAAAVLSMILTPLSIGLAPKLAQKVAHLPALGGWLFRDRGRKAVPTPVEEAIEGELSVPPEPHDLRDHVIIVGFGLGGQNLAKVLRSVEIPYVVLEMNPDSVRRSKSRGEPILYGDCTRDSILEHVRIREARLMAFMISDPGATARGVHLARRMNPHLHIIARTRFTTEIDDLKRLGADEIVPEDFVTSVEIFARVLREYQVPRNQVLDLIDRIRSDQYEALRGLRPAKLNLLQQELADATVLESCRVTADSPAAGRTLAELHLRATTGASLAALRRGGTLLTNPDASTQLQPGDVAILFGDRDQVDRASVLLDPSMARVEPVEAPPSETESADKPTEPAS